MGKVDWKKSRGKINRISRFIGCRIRFSVRLPASLTSQDFSIFVSFFSSYRIPDWC